MAAAIRITPSDAESYVRLRRQMLADAPWAFGSSPEDDFRVSVANIRASLAKPEYAILSVRDGAELVAAAGVMREEKLKRRHVATIWGVFVAPDFRGRGLGRAVVSGAVELARTWPGVTTAQLSVSQNAPVARRMYESMGFVRWGEEPDALRFGGVSYSEIHLSMTL